MTEIIGFITYLFMWIVFLALPAFILFLLILAITRRVEIRQMANQNTNESEFDLGGTVKKDHIETIDGKEVRVIDEFELKYVAFVGREKENR